MLDPVLIIEFVRLSALHDSTLTRGEGGRDHLFTSTLSEHSMMPSFFIAYLSLKTVQLSAKVSDGLPDSVLF